MMDWLLILKIVATVFVSVNARWTYRGMVAEHPDADGAASKAMELFVVVLILSAIWVK